MVTTGSMHSMVPGVQMQSEDLPYSARSISSMQDYVVRGDLVGDAPGSRPQVPGIQLAPGPVFPMPTPQVRLFGVPVVRMCCFFVETDWW